MKLLIRKGVYMYTHNENLGNMEGKAPLKKIYNIIKTTMIAFFSFIFQKVFLNIPQLPAQIKTHVIQYKV